MKININQIPVEGLNLTEEIPSSALDLDTQLVRFPKPVKVEADITKITNALSVNLILSTSLFMNCVRCLSEFKKEFHKSLRLNYQTNDAQPIIDLNPDIREEIILDFPINPLCRPDCKGLCLRCGRNLNEGECNCS